MRQKDKFVPLPDSDTGGGLLEGNAGAVPSIFEDLEPAEEVKGRITVYCIAESIDRKTLELSIKAAYPTPVLHSYPDVIHLNLPVEDSKMGGDVFFFDVRMHLLPECTPCLQFWARMHADGGITTLSPGVSSPTQHMAAASLLCTPAACYPIEPSSVMIPFCSWLLQKF